MGSLQIRPVLSQVDRRGRVGRHALEPFDRFRCGGPSQHPEHN